MSIFTDFNIDFDLFSAVADTPEMFESTGKTNTLRVGREISFKGSINGIEVRLRLFFTMPS